MAIEINKRLENVATDQKLRTGKEVHPRRSDFVEWYYIYIYIYFFFMNLILKIPQRLEIFFELKKYVNEL